MTTRARVRAHAPKEKLRPTCPFGVHGHGSAYAVAFAYAVLLGMASATTPPATEHHYTSGAAVPPPVKVAEYSVLDTTWYLKARALHRRAVVTPTTGEGAISNKRPTAAVP